MVGPPSNRHWSRRYGPQKTHCKDSPAGDALHPQFKTARMRSAVARLLRRMLIRDQRVASQCVRISVVGRTIVLRGAVPNAESLRAAADAAAALPGDWDVQNELEIKPTPHLPDSVVAENVRSALESDARVVKESIIARTFAGVVILNGHVRDEQERLIAGDIALAVPGVRRIENQLRVDVIKRIDDATCSRELRDAINLVVDVNAGRVRVAKAGETVVLSGRVRYSGLREAAEQIARAMTSANLLNDICIST